MGTSTRMSKIDMAAAGSNGTKPLRRIRRRSPTTVAIEEDDCHITQQQGAAFKMSSSGEAVVDFYAELNDACSDPEPSQHEQRAERRRAAHRRRRGDRTSSSSRPDDSGRIGKKECHLLAFAEKIEEQVAEAMNKE